MRTIQGSTRSSGSLIERIPVPPLSDRFLANLQVKLRQATLAQTPTAAHRPRRKALLAALVAAIAFTGALVTMFLVDLPGSPTSSPQVANARELAVLMGDAWTQAATLQATVILHEYSGGTTPVTSDVSGAIVVTAAGDYRIEEAFQGTNTGSDRDLRLPSLRPGAHLQREDKHLAEPRRGRPCGCRAGRKPHYTVLSAYWSGTGPCPLVVDLADAIPDAGFVRAALAETDPTVPVEKTSGRDAQRGVSGSREPTQTVLAQAGTWSWTRRRGSLFTRARNLTEGRDCPRWRGGTSPMYGSIRRSPPTPSPRRTPAACTCLPVLRPRRRKHFDGACRLGPACVLCRLSPAATFGRPDRLYAKPGGCRSTLLRLVRTSA